MEIALPQYEITEIEKSACKVTIQPATRVCGAALTARGRICATKGGCDGWCGMPSWAAQRVWLPLSGHKWACRSCGRGFRERFPGVLPWQQATEAFRFHVVQDHWDGISRSLLRRGRAHLRRDRGAPF